MITGSGVPAGDAAAHAAASNPWGWSCPCAPWGCGTGSPGSLDRGIALSSTSLPPNDALLQDLPRERPIGGGAPSDTDAALSTEGCTPTCGLAPGELAVWVVSFIDTDLRATRRSIAGLSHDHADPDPRTNDRDVTTLGPPTQFDSRAQYLNAAQANLKFPSSFFAGFGAVTLPRDSSVRFLRTLRCDYTVALLQYADCRRTDQLFGCCVPFSFFEESGCNGTCRNSN